VTAYPRLPLRRNIPPPRKIAEFLSGPTAVGNLHMSDSKFMETAMSQLRSLKAQILIEGQDLSIDDSDVARIRACLPSDGTLSHDDIMVLGEMRTEARTVCPAFDKLFFPAFKAYLLADGKITLSEQFLLLRMLYGGGGVDEAERRFLRELRQEAREVSPEFERLYAQAMGQ
jgi:hypothetical protein